MFLCRRYVNTITAGVRFLPNHTYPNGENGNKPAKCALGIICVCVSTVQLRKLKKIEVDGLYFFHEQIFYTKIYSPKDSDTLKRDFLLSWMYPFRATSDAQRPCFEIKRSETPFCAAAEAPPALKLCKPRFRP